MCILSNQRKNWRNYKEIIYIFHVFCRVNLFTVIQIWKYNIGKMYAIVRENLHLIVNVQLVFFSTILCVLLITDMKLKCRVCLSGVDHIVWGYLKWYSIYFKPVLSFLLNDFLIAVMSLGVSEMILVSSIFS